MCKLLLWQLVAVVFVVALLVAVVLGELVGLRVHAAVLVLDKVAVLLVVVLRVGVGQVVRVVQEVEVILQ